MEVDIIVIVTGAIITLGVITILVVLLYKAHSKKIYYENKYSRIIDIDEAVVRSHTEKSKVDNEIVELQKNYKEKRATFDKLIAQVAIYDEEVELAELGYYMPHFDFESSEAYKKKIMNNRDKQKSMLKDKSAVYCKTEWTVEGSKAKGRAMTNKIIRLSTRAFNNECDAAISNVAWNNVERMEQRITKAYDSINKLNENYGILIAHPYLQLKREELYLSYEHKKKKQDEKEEQAEIRQQMREEAKLQKEIETAQKEEEKYQKMLNKAQQEAKNAIGSNLDKLNATIAQLSAELAAAHEKNERAKSMAQQTRSGHVYVISNIGSFGENVYKIGMTRRLEPFDRVKELGDASVPFTFDVHAMIYADDAPTLENTLHKSFDDFRVNLVNGRKEFFNVTLDDIEEEVKKHFPEAEFIETAEAREYKESQSLRAHNLQVQMVNDARNTLPTEI